MKTEFKISLPPGLLRLGIVEAEDVQVGETGPAYLSLIKKEIGPKADPGFLYPENMQKGIRSLLKAYGFQASGRNRPASEFLVKDLQSRGEFNSINNVVDINNHLSLATHLPISILDLDQTGDRLGIRVGLDGEEYVFNREGQALSLKHLLVITRENGDKSIPVGSPVKDCQATKIFDHTRRVFGVVYTSRSLTPKEALAQMMERFSDLLKKEASATCTSWEVLDTREE